MKKLLVACLVLSLLTSCRSDKGPTGTAAEQPPKTDSNQNPTEVPEEPSGPNATEPDGLGFSVEEMVWIQSELRNDGEVPPGLSEVEKRLIAGAKLFVATEKIKPLNWEKLGDSEIESLEKAFFKNSLTAQ